MIFFYQEEVQGFERVTEPGLIKDPADIDKVRGEYAFPNLTQEDVLKLPYIKHGTLQFRA